MRMRKPADDKEFVITNFKKLQSDFEFYSKSNLQIATEEAGVIKFEFNRMQKYLWSVIQDKINNNQPIRLAVLKARQLGSSTFAVALFYWLVSTRANRTALVVAHDNPTSYALGNKIRSFYLRSIPTLKPNVARLNRSEIWFANDIDSEDIGLDSKVVISTADNPMLGRGLTLQYALLSEAPLYGELGISLKDRLAGLSQAIPYKANTAVILEGTAKGEGEFSEIWYGEDNGFDKIFISWLCEDDYRIDISPEQYFELDDRENSKYGDETLISGYIKRELKKWYSEESKDQRWITNETMARLYWRREMIDKNLNGDKIRFAKEYPTTPEDAFLTTSNSVFDTIRIAEILSEINKNNIRPNKFRYHHDPDYVDSTKCFYEAKHGHLRIYELPVEGGRYIIGADGAQGVAGGDDSSIVVLKATEILTEVASFNDIISPSYFARIQYALAKFYNNALIIPERNDKGGFAAILDLVNHYNYYNIYFEQDLLTKKIGNTIRWGWRTTPINRSVLIADTNRALQNGDLILYSTEILDQMKQFVLDKNGKPQSKIGYHDDLVFALMLAVQGSKRLHEGTVQPIVNLAPKGSPNYIIAQEMSKNRLMNRYGFRLKR